MFLDVALPEQVPQRQGRDSCRPRKCDERWMMANQCVMYMAEMKEITEGYLEPTSWILQPAYQHAG
jgi:hypothetical protein